jgi:hypothetical protein
MFMKDSLVQFLKLLAESLAVSLVVLGLLWAVPLLAVLLDY